MGFVPVNLGPAGRAIGKPDAREPLSFPLSAWTVNLAKAFPLPDPSAGGDGFKFGHRIDNLEVHCVKGGVKLDRWGGVKVDQRRG